MGALRFLDFSSEEKKVIIPFLLLMAFGLLMVYSSSYFYAKEIFQDAAYLVKKQFLFFFVGLLAIIFIRNSTAKWFFKYSTVINILIIILMSITLVPGMTPRLKGAHRWIQFGIFQIQPGEFIKFTIIPFFFSFIMNFKEYDWKKKILYLSIVALPGIIFFLQPDFGGLVVYSFVLAFVAFMSPISRRIFYSAAVFMIVGGSYALVQMPYRVKRLLTFLDPWKDPQNSGFQIIQSYLALAHGHIWGKGLGNSKEKLFYLPEAHNDFIFSVIGEEFGLVGVFGVMGLFTLFFAFGPRLIKKSTQLDFIIYMSGLYFIIGLQVILNLGVVFGLLPTKGLNLPFISYGGSSLVSNCLGIGLLLCLIRASQLDQFSSEEYEYQSE